MKSSLAGRVPRALLIAAALFAVSPSAAPAADTRPPSRLLDLMAQGKTETDLGHFDAAIRALGAVVDAPDASPALRAEALVRLGVARRGAGDAQGALQAFQRVADAPNLDAPTKALLVRALGGALPSAKRWAEVWPRVSFVVDRSQPTRPAMSVVWPEAPGSQTHTGDAMTIQLADADLNNVFLMIADISGLNVVVFPGVSGKATLDASNEPWDRVLERALAPNGLASQREDNVLLVARPEYLPAPRHFSGQRIDVDFHDADLRKSLAELAARGAARTEIDPTVAGRVTLRLNQVRWDQALEILVRVNGLDWAQDGDVVKVFVRER
ncbi:MAG: hypothetical protein DMF78_09930 [Acidobacteria bacterium]|nr:MAG: hypothetical protein DMF78_09930 [Acidobacteriota bacterium]